MEGNRLIAEFKMHEDLTVASINTATHMSSLGQERNGKIAHGLYGTLHKSQLETFHR